MTDVLALGEVMLRLDPGEGRIRTTRTFQVWEGGGEYNVVRGLRRCFGLRTAVVTALADNAVGRLVEDLILQGGVDTTAIRWIPDDGIGRTARNGLNFVERGYGIRGALGVSDRANTAVSQLRKGDIDWDTLFSTGVRWFHTGGIFAGLSDTTTDVADEAMTAARRHGVTVSYDPNYRPSLWTGRGGPDHARETDLRLARHADVVVGALGLAGSHPGAERFTPDEVPDALTSVAGLLPEAKVLATTLRDVPSAGVNDWTSAAWSPQTGHVTGPRMPGLHVLDRIGSGDAFAAGLLYGLLTGTTLEHALAYGTAHGALTMTTPGDVSMASLDEIEALIAGGSAHVRR
ncbi:MULTISPECIES: sugar kinase [Streptomyces]|uniref:sugar kinase n=1 Tax=Streptomyces TaxID=1883 RepID=UPI000BCD0A15|nr:MULTISPECIES: sugar kinase [Streptomyces]MDX2550354.1 sugar kinase [Streptomyces stelliscabiei]MDX2610052.1 sugar kinase [Streptomyces stelliscabiei]MDX2635026.1 sugar kinase [Streptomyces stelliscabiei]MDX2659972.1 sugar kinase [Streptomyces stelliscabiei]MDX2711334.1 sugar kinase [Streptomyces stelliscabiei]